MKKIALYSIAWGLMVALSQDYFLIRLIIALIGGQLIYLYFKKRDYCLLCKSDKYE